MADNGATKMKEEATKHQPTMDVMVATFADRKAAKDAYQTLRSMSKEGTISMGGAVVIDRDEMGKMHLQAKLPGWFWGLVVGSSLLVAGMVGAIVWLAILAARGAKARRMAEGGQMSTEYSV